MEHLGPLCAIYVSSNLDFKAATDPELEGTFGTVYNIRSVDSSSVNIFSRALFFLYYYYCNLYTCKLVNKLLVNL